MNFIAVNHAVHQQTHHQDFVSCREEDSGDYMFVHFISSVQILCDNKYVIADPTACIVYKVGTIQYFKALNELLKHDFIQFSLMDEEIFEFLKLPLNRIFYPYENNSINEMIQKIEYIYINKPPYYKVMLSGCMTCLFAELARFAKASDAESDDGDLFTLKVKLEELRCKIYNSTSKWTVPKMANSMNYSRTYFSRLYKDFNGISPGEDIIQSTLNNAKQLLKTTDLSVTAISKNVGYESIEHFMRLFKNREGSTPIQYRESQRSVFKK